MDPNQTTQPLPNPEPVPNSQPVPTPQTQPVQVPPPAPQKSNSKLLLLLPILLFLLLAIIGYFVYSQGYLSQLIAKPTTLLTQTTQPTVTPSPDPTADWGTYTNSTHGITFKYTKTWELTASDETAPVNTSVKLTKGDTKITMYLAMDGIGGQGRSYNGETFVLDGNNLFQYKAENSYDNSVNIGITDSLTNSLGVFKVNDTTYSIVLNYPNSYTEVNQLKQEFNQILSTFKFIKTNNSMAESCLAQTTCTEGTPCMANPASVFCECMGGKSEIIDGQNGQTGTCTIDNHTYDEWDYFQMYQNEATPSSSPISR